MGRLVITMASTLTFIGWCSVALPARAESIANGGFESPSIGGSPFVEYPPGAPTGWTIVSGSVDLVTHAFLGVTPFEGQQLLDLDGTSPRNGKIRGVIEQDFATVSGAQYVLSFMYANNPNPIGGTIPAQMEVTVSSSNGTVSSRTLTHSTSTPSDLDWMSFALTFVANQPVSTLRFTSLSPDSSKGGIFLDAVSVSAQPMPTPTPSTCDLCSVDGDGDGRRDLDDACPGTAPGASVDLAGCSAAQFCESFDARTVTGKMRCKKGDWKNNEPVMSGKSHDCRVDKQGRGIHDDVCVPTDAPD